jgi:hypothetical protein
MKCNEEERACNGNEDVGVRHEWKVGWNKYE